MGWHFFFGALISLAAIGGGALFYIGYCIYEAGGWH